MRVRLSAPLGAVLVALTLLCVGILPPAAGPAWAADTNPNAQRKGSGLPIPRFASLKSDEVNVRTGPGSRYPIDWVFKRKGMPVEIVAEFENWRKIRDWQGAGGWVYQGLLTGDYLTAWFLAGALAIAAGLAVLAIRRRPLVLA